MEIDFKTHLKKYLTEFDINNLISALEQKQKYSCIIIDEEKIKEDTLLSIYPNLIKHSVVKNAYLYDKNEYELGKSLLFEIGAFYILEPCSPLVGYFLNPNENDLILDIAASPGGKSIHTSFLMKNKGLIISNEISPSRAEILSSNSEKYGRKNIIVTSNDIFKFSSQFENTFSKIILDAPCSGSGMFRKEEKMKEDWTYQKVLSCARIQKELILEAYKMLVDGGEMIYSTCSYSYEEDEEIINYLLSNTDAILIDLPHIKGEYRSSLSQTIHLFPHLFDGEGHFIAKIKKPKNINYPIINKSKKEFFILNQKIDEEIYENKNKELYLVNHTLNLNKFHILRTGIKIGIKDKKLGIIFDHNYARYKNNLLPKVEVNETQAKQFIYGLTLPTSLENGYVSLCYLTIPFALGKISNGQIKNHYPKGLRKKI